MPMRELPDCFRCKNKDCHYIDPDGSCSRLEVDWVDGDCESYKPGTKPLSYDRDDLEDW